MSSIFDVALPKTAELNKMWSPSILANINGVNQVDKTGITSATGDSSASFVNEQLVITNTNALEPTAIIDPAQGTVQVNNIKIGSTPTILGTTTEITTEQGSDNVVPTTSAIVKYNNSRAPPIYCQSKWWPTDQFGFLDTTVRDENTASGFGMFSLDNHIMQIYDSRYLVTAALTFFNNTPVASSYYDIASHGGELPTANDTAYSAGMGRINHINTSIDPTDIIPDTGNSWNDNWKKDNSTGMPTTKAVVDYAYNKTETYTKTEVNNLIGGSSNDKIQNTDATASLGFTDSSNPKDLVLTVRRGGLTATPFKVNANNIENAQTIIPTLKSENILLETGSPASRAITNFDTYALTDSYQAVPASAFLFSIYPQQLYSSFSLNNSVLTGSISQYSIPLNRFQRIVINLTIIANTQSSGQPAQFEMNTIHVYNGSSSAKTNVIYLPNQFVIGDGTATSTLTSSINLEVFNVNHFADDDLYFYAQFDYGIITNVTEVVYAYIH